VLAKHGVRYVLIGALAARLQGFPRVTADADITPSDDRENLEKLAAALRELGARVYTRSKRAADRPQDRHDVIVLEEMLRRRDRGG
jgi:hypothetical protein